MTTKRQKQISALAGFAVMSASILLMPLNLGVLSGCLFWGGLLWGCVCQWSVYNGNGSRKKGIFTFFSGKKGKIVDTAMILLVAAAVAAMAVDGYGYICYVLLAAAAFSISLHCVVNSNSFAEMSDRTSDQTPAEKKDSNRKKGGKRTR